MYSAINIKNLSKLPKAIQDPDGEISAQLKSGISSEYV
jgi:hypothetical protein